MRLTKLVPKFYGNLETILGSKFLIKYNTKQFKWQICHSNIIKWVYISLNIFKV